MPLTSATNIVSAAATARALGCEFVAQKAGLDAQMNDQK